MKKILLLLPLLFLATPALAANDPFAETYAERKHAILTDLDKCDFINAKEIMMFSSIPVQILDADIKNTRNLFKETSRARSVCFEEVMSKLDDLIGLSERHLKNNDDIILFHQSSLDNELLSLIKQRSELTKRLLNSILADIESTIKNMPADIPALPTEGEVKSTYYNESEKTGRLVRMDMTLVMEMDRRQEVLDELALTFAEHPSLSRQAAVKISRAHHYISRALLAFEDAYTEPQMVTLARLNSEITYATLQLAEILAVNPTMTDLPATTQQSLAVLYRKSRDLQRDISGAHADMMENIFTPDFSAWMSELYEDLSQVGYSMQTLKADLENKIAPPPVQTPAEFVDHMLNEIQKMDEDEALAVSKTEEIQNLEEMESLEDMTAEATEATENVSATAPTNAPLPELPEAEEITLPVGAQLGAKEFVFEEPEAVEEEQDSEASPAQPIDLPEEDQQEPTNQ